MAHRSLATRIWGHAASALRRHPPPGHLGPGVPPPPAAYGLRRHPAPGHLSLGVPAAPALYRFVGTTCGQAKHKPLRNIKRIQQEAVYMLELQYLLVQLEKAGKIAQQRAVELEQVRYQKKKARMIYGFTLAALCCESVYLTRL